MKKNKLPVLEHDIQNLIIDYLWKKKYYVQRMNSGRTTLAGKKKVRYGKIEVEVDTERHVMLGDPGTPDIMAFKSRKSNLFTDVLIHPSWKEVELLFIEVKRPGNKPTQIQKAKMKQLEEYGALCIVATSLEDLEAEGI